jgi:DNA-binding transcriptional regulator YdaS (Cro superfamily)
MRTQEAVDHFGSQVALAQAIGVKQNTVSGWSEYPPMSRQIDIEVATSGKLKAELSEDARRVLAKPKAGAA